MAVVAACAEDRVAELFQALSDPKRIRILGLLTRGEMCVCELTEALDLPQSLLSFHLRTLRDAGLVADRRDGRWVHYSLRPAVLDEAQGALAELTVEPAPTRRAKAARC